MRITVSKRAIKAVIKKRNIKPVDGEYQITDDMVIEAHELDLADPPPEGSKTFEFTEENIA